jgi:hypothetical protein
MGCCRATLKTAGLGNPRRSRANGPGTPAAPVGPARPTGEFLWLPRNAASHLGTPAGAIAYISRGASVDPSRHAAVRVLPPRVSDLRMVELAQSRTLP